MKLKQGIKEGGSYFIIYQYIGTKIPSFCLGNKGKN
jgi:hypothetical protein